jgi:integrase
MNLSARSLFSFKQSGGFIVKKFPKPWFRPPRNRWFVTLNVCQINLGSEKSVAFERYRALLAKPQQAEVHRESLAGLIDAFLEWCHRHRSPHTYEWYRYRLQRFIERYPTLTVQQLRPFHVQEWVDSYDFSKTSRRNYVRSVKRCIAWSVAQGYVEKNPILHLEVPTAEAKEILITPDEYEQFLSFVTSSSLRDLVEVTWETGCRPQESLRVEVRHFDEKNQRWVFPRKESKGKRAPRVVYLTEKAGDIDSFMESYWNSEDLTFSSGGKVTRTWQGTLDNYKERYPTLSEMGKLSFLNLEVTPLGTQAAFVLGEWHLSREAEDLGGIFTLVFRRMGEQWVIVHDQTSRTVEP